MALLLFVVTVLIVVGIVCAIAASIPFPAPVGWLRWVIPVLALVIGLVLILQHLGVA